ncbi:MAG: hypothetical protein PWP31_1749 [Clostridia bacterium]|nr:hypothetical protein [Clostridia bacterium]
MIIRKLLLEQKGSALILISLAMTALLGIVSLVTDVGLVYVSKFNLVNAVDAAALAGTQELPDRPQKAKEVAKNYAIANGVNENLDIELLNDYSLKVHASREIDLLFAKVIGFNKGFVSHEAIAQVAPIIKTSGVVPLGLEKQELKFGEQYNLKVGAGAAETGWFGALALGGSGASRYEDNLTYGYKETLQIGDIVEVENGNMSNPTKRAIDDRIFSCDHYPYCTVDKFDRNCRRLVKIPIVEVLNKKSVRIVGFTMFLLDGVMGQGKDCYVKGKFVKTIIPGEVSTEAENFGLLGVRLIE